MTNAPDISKEAVERFSPYGLVHDDGRVQGVMEARKNGKYVLHSSFTTQAARIAELEAEKQSLKTDLEDLQMEYDEHQTKVSADFEGDCWVSMRGLLEITGFKDWSDPDGVTADMAYQHIKEALIAKDTP